MIEKGANLTVASLGEVTVFYTEKGLKSLHLWQKPVPGYDKKRFPWPELEEKLNWYFEGRLVSFSFPVDLSWSTEFTAKVLLATAAVPYGQTATYGELAAAVGSAGAARAVGRSLSINKLPIVIPCHRVIRNDGHMGGFSAPGGIDQKLSLLQMEKRALGGYHK